MKLPQLSLRTLFWMLFAAAIGIGWARDGYQMRRDIPEPDFFCPNVFDRSVYNSLVRREMLVIAELSDDSMMRTLTTQVTSGEDSLKMLDSPGYFHVFLTALVQRDLHDCLAQLCEPGAMKSEQGSRNIDAVTMLRRRQNQSDPIKIRVRVIKGGSESIIEATVENVDPERRSLHYEAGLETSGRPPHWRVRLADDQGYEARASDAEIADSVSTSDAVLDFGEERVFRFAAREYFARLASGPHQLQLFHSSEEIADDHEMEHLIVWQSKPLSVWITNNVHQDRGLSTAGLSSIAVLALGVVVVSRCFTRKPRRLLSDCVATVVILAIAGGWWYDSRMLRPRLPDPPHAEANWTMEEIPAS